MKVRQNRRLNLVQSGRLSQWSAPNPGVLATNNLGSTGIHQRSLMQLMT